jgi:hypothetical protein
MQLRAGVGAQANDIPGIGRNFGLEEDDIKHDGCIGLAGWTSDFPLLMMVVSADRGWKTRDERGE